MSEDLGRAVLSLETDPSKLRAGMAAARSETLGTLKSAQRSLMSMSTELVKGVGQGLGQAAFGLVKDGIHAIGQWVGSTIKAASDVREAMSLTAQVFEGNTDQMLKWSDGAARAFGASKREALNFAASFGTTLKNVGFSLDETSDKSQRLTRLAADLGSAFNASSAEAATALRSGLLGESEPLRRFGVFLSEAAVKSKAVALGIARMGDELTDAQKVTARYAIIMEQTRDSQGMFGRDAQSLADAQKRLDAVTENLSARLGLHLLPVMTAAAQIATVLVEHWDDVAPVLVGIGAAILVTLIPALYRMAVAAVAATGPFAPLTALLVALGVAAASSAGKGIDDLRSSIAELEADTGWGRNQKLIDELKRKLADLEAQAAATAAGNKELVERLKADWQNSGIPQVVGGVVTKIGTELTSGKYTVRNGAVVLARGLPDAVSSGGRAAVAAVRQSIDDMAQAIRDGRRALVSAMNEVVDDAYDPLILAANITATKIELAEQRKIVASRKSTAAEKREAAARILDLQKQLATQLNEQTQYGTAAQRMALLAGRATSKELVAGLKSGDEARRKASLAAANEIASEIIALQNRTKTYGMRTGNAYVDGLIVAFEDRVESVRRAFNPYRTMFKASSPPGPESPLHLIDVWARRTGEAWVSPFVDAIARGEAAIRRHVGGVAGALVPEPGQLAALTRSGPMVVRHLHEIDAKSAANLAAAGVDPREFARGLADASADGLFGHLQNLQAMSGS